MSIPGEAASKHYLTEIEKTKTNDICSYFRYGGTDTQAHANKELSYMQEFPSEKMYEHDETIPLWS